MTPILQRISTRWQSEAGYRQVLTMAIPLILSTGAWSVQHFVDRMFLTWYAPEAIAAAMPAGMLNFTVLSFFLGTAGYVNTFVAQYHGSGQHARIGPALWQGIHIAAVGGIILLGLIPLARPVFGWIGHEGAIQHNEVVYFQMLCLGAGPAIASSAMGGFFSGRGKTWPVMWINVLGTAANLAMDYVLIFGHLGFPELGIRGAGIATVLSTCFSCGIFLALILRGKYVRKYNTRSWQLDRGLFARLIRFGAPNGAQFFIDIAGFTVFILLMGRLGTTPLAATNIAFNINSLAFMPMIGFGIAVSVLVGQYLGKGRSDLAERSVYSGFHLTFLYMTTIAALYVLVPNMFLRPFAAQADAASFAEIRALAVILLRFVAVYSVFDTLNIIFAAGIKGAGDTRYVMVMILAVSLLVLVVPSYVVLVLLHRGIYAGWTIASAYIILMGFAFLFRFLGGKWKNMRVIEEVPPSLPSMFPEAPVPELDWVSTSTSMG
ncbi:MAG: MATE family efflux transporter [Candidatus Latescibacterota bacterium]